MPPTHTPTPWKVNEGPNQKGWIVADGYMVARLDLGAVPKVPAFDQPTRDANAAFIVRAVNAHDAMLAIVKEDRGRYQDGTPRALELDALIAKAEGR